MIAVRGRLQTGSYKNKDGQTVYTTDVIADHVEFLEWGEREQKEINKRDPREDIPDGFAALNEDVPF